MSNAPPKDAPKNAPQEAPRPSLASKLKDNPKLEKLMGLYVLVKDTVIAIRFPNRHVRQISALFILSCTALLVTSILTLRRLKHDVEKFPHSIGAWDKALKRKEAAEKKTEDEVKRKASMADLGRFMVDLRALPGTPKGANNRLEIQIYGQCDSQEAREYFEARPERVRDLLVGVLSAVDRETLMSKDGKRQVKRLMIDRLNKAMPEAKVNIIYFSWLKIG